MTPKEKADSIFQQMYKILWHTNSNPIHCKECALIAVDEIIEELSENADGEVKSMRIIYWKKVNQEINKL
jgi:hypothetical protein